MPSTFYDQLPATEKSKRNFSHATFFLASMKKMKISRNTKKSSSVPASVCRDHLEKTIIKIKKTVHNNKKQNSAFNPSELFRHQPFICISSIVPRRRFFWPGSASRVEWWASQPGTKRVLRGSGAIVWRVFLSTRCLMWVFYAKRRAPLKSKFE